MNQKLAFNKETVANLNDNNMSQINGGKKGFLSIGKKCTTMADVDCLQTSRIFCQPPKLQ